jgi:hypothetical protein
MDKNIIIIGTVVASFVAVNYLLNRMNKYEQKSNAIGGRCTCSDGTTGYCATKCSTCCARLGGEQKIMR